MKVEKLKSFTLFNYIKEKVSNFISSSLISIFKIGAHIPKSIAIIMDGNRRYAQKNKFQKIQGHEDGLSTLLKVLIWCIDLEIKELTVFAFSIDNFNRPKEEIEALMKLAQEKFSKLSERGEYLNNYGVKVSFFGNLNLENVPHSSENVQGKMSLGVDENNQATLGQNNSFLHGSVD
jgi:ditrans,polycis-polyprenyl diphosphate synthase